MDYNQWSNEYYTQADNIKSKLDILKKQRKYCQGIDIKEYNRRIDILTDMYHDCIYAGNQLKLHMICKGGNAIA